MTTRSKRLRSRASDDADTRAGHRPAAETAVHGRAHGRGTAARLLFIAHRAPAKSAAASEPYTTDRSLSVAFGSTSILFARA